MKNTQACTDLMTAAMNLMLHAIAISDGVNGHSAIETFEQMVVPTLRTGVEKHLDEYRVEV